MERNRSGCLILNDFVDTVLMKKNQGAQQCAEFDSYFGNKMYVVFKKTHTKREIDISLLVIIFHLEGASLVAQLVKNLPAMQETWV